MNEAIASVASEVTGSHQPSEVDLQTVKKNGGPKTPAKLDMEQRIYADQQPQR